jgi:poly-beta-1,6-N-acetyl-D-glucosamine synthase
MQSNCYALITAVRNEETYIRQTLESVVNQSHVPTVWVIVSDGSIDRTEEIVADFARRYNFIRLTRLPNEGARAFSNKVRAVSVGYESVRHSAFDFVGFLDGDISFDANYYESVLEKFHANPRLGIAGCELHEYRSGRFDRRRGSGEEFVAGAIQFFRRRCYEDIGGFLPLYYGGDDTVANAMATRKGWEVRSFFDLRAFHHRPTGTAGTTVWRARFRQGREDYFMGYHPLFEMGKCVRRVVEPPICVGSVLRFWGYAFSGIARQRRMVPDDFVRYVQQEQKRRIWQAVFGR